MRMFVALRPSLSAIEHLDAFLESRRAAGDFRWSDPDQIHLTLAFLADVADHQLDELAENLGVAASRRQRFDAGIAGGGAFPDAGRGRVLWAGLDLEPAAGAELDRLAVGARNAAATAGIAVDGQRFRPHLTVARCAQPTELTRWIRLLDNYAGPAWPVTEVALMASHLGEGRRRRPRYEQLAAFSLA